MKKVLQTMLVVFVNQICLGQPQPNRQQTIEYLNSKFKEFELQTPNFRENMECHKGEVMSKEQSRIRHYKYRIVSKKERDYIQFSSSVEITRTWKPRVYAVSDYIIPVDQIQTMTVGNDTIINRSWTTENGFQCSRHREFLKSIFITCKSKAVREKSHVDKKISFDHEAQIFLTESNENTLERISKAISHLQSFQPATTSTDPFEEN